MWILFSKLAAMFLYPMGFMILCLILGLFFKLIRRKKTAVFLFFLSIMTLISTSSPWVSAKLVSHLERQYDVIPIDDLPKSEVVVMLGGALALPIPPRPVAELVHSSDRVLHTARIYRAGKANRVFLAGGNVLMVTMAKAKPTMSGSFCRSGVFQSRLLIMKRIPEILIRMQLKPENILNSQVSWIHKFFWSPRPSICLAQWRFLDR